MRTGLATYAYHHQAFACIEFSPMARETVRTMIMVDPRSETVFINLEKAREQAQV